ncbi:MAG: MCE family protein [Mycobacterium sp.]|nr:MCE family protein [Mycobacterium sp.]
MTAPLNKPPRQPLKLAGAIMTAIFALIFVFVVLQYQGALTPKIKVNMLAERSGLLMETGSRVTLNGVSVGRVIAVDPTVHDGKQMAKLVTEINKKYVPLIPENVKATVDASTIFGNKFVALSSPADAQKKRISPTDTVMISNVSTEWNTLFETITALSEKIDPVKLNLTLSATAEALNGMGTKLGKSLIAANQVLGDLNPHMSELRYDVQQLNQFAGILTGAAPDLLDTMDSLSVTARTINGQKRELDVALLAAAGFANNGADIFERGAPYLVRAVSDLLTTSNLLNKYSPELNCTLRNLAEGAKQASKGLGGNGYSLNTMTSFLGAPNPYVYPDNLPRVNAQGGPGGAPGCWQKVTKEFWPAPHLVMDIGASIAPYNHIEFGMPIANEYVWGRQIGENTINP